jgi:hypothetical protein
MKFELNTLPRDCSDDDIITEIRRVASIVGKKILTTTDFDKYSKIHSSTIRRRFGGWQKVLEKAGINEKYSGKIVSGKMKTQQTKNLTNDEVLNELRRIAKELNRDFITQEDVNNNSEIMAASAVAYRFGSWLKGLEKTGLKKSTQYRRKFSEEELFENILNVWTHYGRQPYYREMGIAPSTISPGTYENRFGSWRNALEAFVGKMNQEDSNDKFIKNTPDIQEQSEPRRERQISCNVHNGDNRSINLSLRYKVLSRDNFRCVRCGRSPATDTNVELHVDHKQPSSKQGKTTLENLETKCKECNLGKSNRYIE